MLSFIVWDVSPEIFRAKVFGLLLEPRWYGLFFALGFLIGQQILFHIFKKEGKPAQDVETLTVYMVLATVIGARLGHVLFYEPQEYFKDFDHILEIFKIWHGGLASHGAAIAILFTFWLYVRKKKNSGQTYLWVADRIVIIVALCGCLIRLGNLMNSEIIGKPTDASWGFVFAGPARSAIMTPFPEDVTKVRTQKDESRKDTTVNGQIYVPLKVKTYLEKEAANSDMNSFAQRDIPPALGQSPEVREHFSLELSRPFTHTVSNEDGETVVAVNVYGIPRHPAQLYESFSCLLLCILLFLIWNRYKAQTPQGLLLGLFLIVCFGLRFFYETLKEPQVDFEREMPLYMGQWLSIPAILAGIIIIIIALRNSSKLNTDIVSKKA
ncbi:prolipoprotein diacylglyceryl transferase [Cytophagaceae bacterium DM2B3-1]|uniref:Phosphatidylglycerol--prolipoprotein diacylglyceryl transferase n=1 Tax=Xanthocytophaga flava TaxID=3048013 RepID=A0AAE3QM47_9BACT|nr:prolipoprotein diacylglyceryl transferase [Xanthocytophaga flavus]MDJ1466497.1 prolipoprotein diacylglyceryl transferase [Xanthocytophaga flavus]MDJ1479153.1 prolipoprotein diacylglyceryl transferase [Xanthocytophaga flavus]MDJ1492494.1 prolipoprotein diacylglyceryl transferase [Xanthocytophaga flavus]